MSESTADDDPAARDAAAGGAHPTRTDEPATTDDEPLAATKPWGVANWTLIGLFGALTLAGVALTSGIFGTHIVSAPAEAPADVVVPLFVYVYATLGAMGYVFTKLMADVGEYDEARELGQVVEMLVRIPAAWVLAAGIYLATVQAGTNPADNPHLLATLAFLVGLYVNVAIKSLGSLADRMLGRRRAT